MKRISFEELLKLPPQTRATNAKILEYCRYTPASAHTDDEWMEVYKLTSEMSEAETAVNSKVSVIVIGSKDQYYDADYPADEEE